MNNTLSVLGREYSANNQSPWQKIEVAINLVTDKRFSAQYRIEEALKDVHLFKDINQPEAVVFYKALWLLIKQAGTVEHKFKFIKAMNVANDQKFLGVDVDKQLEPRGIFHNLIKQ